LKSNPARFDQPGISVVVADEIAALAPTFFVTPSRKSFEAARRPLDPTANLKSYPRYASLLDGGPLKCPQILR
jgi:hypothetical protein